MKRKPKERTTLKHRPPEVRADRCNTAQEKAAKGKYTCTVVQCNGFKSSFDVPCRTGKKTGKEKQTSEQPTEEGGSGLQEAEVAQGLLPPDPGVWEHINYIHTNIKNLETVKMQAERLAV